MSGSDYNLWGRLHSSFSLQVDDDALCREREISGVPQKRLLKSW